MFDIALVDNKALAWNEDEQTDTLVVFFEINKASIDFNNIKPLEELIANKNIISVSIYGYTDFTGSVAYNQQLSENRSANVYNYLIERGFPKENIVISKGKGVYPDSSKENRQDFSDKGIKAHRIVKIIYTAKTDEIFIVENEEEREEEETDSLLEEDYVADNLPEDNFMLNNLSEENLVADNLILLENVVFYGGTNRLLPESYPALEKLLSIMKNHNTLKIEIQGHICCSNLGFDHENEPLSLSRAKAVYDYLSYNGIMQNRMTYKGFGSSRKLFPLERNSYEMSMNRRVEILILER